MSEALRRGAIWLTIVLAAAALTTTASAMPQFDPVAGDLIHTDTSGQPGVEWDTDGLGSGGELSYDSGSGILTIDGGTEVMNYYNAANGLCSSDTGGNCAFNFSPNLDFTFQAQIVPGTFGDLTITPLGPGPFGNLSAVQVQFETLGTAAADLVSTDPSDGNSVQLEADVVAGLFNGTAIAGVVATILYDDVAGVLFSDVSGAAIFDVLGGNHASMFGTSFGLGLSSIGEFDDGSGGDLNAIVAAALGNSGILPGFTAEGAGEMFRVTDGDFELPEPSTALLLMGGLLGFAIRRR